MTFGVAVKSPSVTVRCAAGFPAAETWCSAEVVSSPLNHAIAMTVNRKHIAHNAEGVAVHAAAMMTWLGAVALWAAYCERHRHAI